MAPAKNRLLLLDGHSLAYRAFYALPAENFSTKTGQNTNAVYGFTSMLINMLRDEEPTHIAVAFDLSRQTFRLEEYAEYKAGRSATPTEFSGQIPLVHEVLDALKIRYVEAPGYEADDIIATLTTEAVAQEMEVVIVSGDRDVFQLVSDDVTMVYPVRGVSDVWRMDPKAVQERYLVPPERYSDLAALVGESSDNLPGVPGVGPKTAAKWITTYGDLHGIVANIDQIGGKVGTALREHLDGVLRNRRLNQLVRDVDLGVTVDELERQSRRVAPLGWHLVLHIMGDYLVEHEAELARLEIPVVIDHLAHLNLTEGLDQPAVKTIQRLLATGNWWIRLSNGDRVSREPSGFRDVAPLISLLADTAPERALWGTDWPHSYYKKTRMPDDRELIELLYDAIPDPELRHQILVDNPRALYGKP